VALERAVELSDDDPTILEHLADTYYARRDYQGALSTYKRVLKLEPGRKDIADKIRKIRAESGEK
jgi:cytochrome c-type biogenesis protein CcmH/NrfG